MARTAKRKLKPRGFRWVFIYMRTDNVRNNSPLSFANFKNLASKETSNPLYMEAGEISNKTNGYWKVSDDCADARSMVTTNN
jgi:hypothetical protein